MKAENSTRRAERMPLWLVFIPLSPIAAMLYSMREWRRMKLGLFNRHKTYATFCIVTVTTILGFIFCTPLMRLAADSGSILLQLAVQYLCLRFISLIIREVDYRTRKRYFEKHDSSR